MWDVVQDGSFVPMKEIDGKQVSKTREEMTPQDKKNIVINAKAMNVLYYALNEYNFNKVQACTSAKEIWELLMVSNEGTSQVKETKISMLTHSYEFLKMNENETISDMFDRFITIVNELKNLSKVYTD